MARTLDTTYHDRRLSRRLEDPEFRREFERQQREIAQIDTVVRQLDELREEAGMSKAELARAIGKEPSSIRRFFTADVNPELKTVAAVADIRGRGSRCGQRSKPRGAGRKEVLAPHNHCIVSDKMSQVALTSWTIERDSLRGSVASRP